MFIQDIINAFYRCSPQYPKDSSRNHLYKTVMRSLSLSRENNNEKNSDQKHQKCILLLVSAAGADPNGSWSILEFGAAAFFWARRLPGSRPLGLGSRVGRQGWMCQSRETSAP